MAEKSQSESQTKDSDLVHFSFRVLPRSILRSDKVYKAYYSVNHIMSFEGIKNLLEKELEDISDASELTNKILALFIEEKEPIGGLYCVEITKMTSTDPIVFTRNNEITDKFALIKFGRTEKFDRQFKEFSFKYRVIFKRNWDSNAEAKFKKLVPVNFKKFYFPKAKVKTIKNQFKLCRSPGPTEWRIISRAALNRLEVLMKENHLNWFNYSAEMPNIFNDELKMEKGELELQVPGFERANLQTLIVKHFRDETTPDTDANDGASDANETDTESDA